MATTDRLVTLTVAALEIADALNEIKEYMREAGRVATADEFLTMLEIEGVDLADLPAAAMAVWFGLDGPNPSAGGLAAT